MRKLSTLDKGMILQTYRDADPSKKRQTIEALASTCDVDVETICEVIKQDKLDKAAKKEKERKRPGPKPRDPKPADPDPDDVKIYEPVRSELPHPQVMPTELPEYIRDILFERFKELETELDGLEKRLAETKSKYGLLKKYLFES
jgi:hypothetical protein